MAMLGVIIRIRLVVQGHQYSAAALGQVFGLSVLFSLFLRLEWLFLLVNRIASSVKEQSTHNPN